MRESQPKLTLYLADAGGSVGQCNFWVRWGLSDAAVLAGALGGIDLVEPLTDAAITGFTIIHKAIEEPMPVPPGPSVCPSAGAFVFSCGSESAYMSVPAIRDEYLITSGCGEGVKIDLFNPAIAAIVTNLITIGCNPFGTPLTALASGMRQELWRGR